MRKSNDGTRRRLMAAASELFAERGFHATTARDIARRARVNLAAGHYHYGSKKELYLAVLREQFATVRKELDRRGGTLPAAEIERLDRAALEKLLLTRIKVMLDILIGPPPALHGALMQREMTDPSQALPMIVAEFIDPMMRELEQIVAHLVPGLRRSEVELCTVSIVSQAIFYRFAMPAILHGKRWRAYPEGFGTDLARHIAEFSLGGMESVGSRRSGRPRAR
jgi:AcrR family transcriptional regulator